MLPCVSFSLQYIFFNLSEKTLGAVMVMIAQQMDLQLPVQSVSITTNVVSSWRDVLDTTLDDKVCQ